MNIKPGMLLGVAVFSVSLRSARACPESGTPAQMAQCAANTKAFDDQAAASAKALNDQAAQALQQLAQATLQSVKNGQPLDPQLEVRAAQAAAAAKAASATAAQVHSNAQAADAALAQSRTSMAAQDAQNENLVAAAHAAAVAAAAAQPVAICAGTNLPCHIQADGNLHYADGSIANSGWWPTNAGANKNQMTLAASGGAQIAYTAVTGILPQKGAGTIDAGGNQVITGEIGGVPATMVISPGGQVTISGYSDSSPSGWKSSGSQSAPKAKSSVLGRRADSGVSARPVLGVVSAYQSRNAAPTRIRGRRIQGTFIQPTLIHSTPIAPTDFGQ